MSDLELYLATKPMPRYQWCVATSEETAWVETSHAEHALEWVWQQTRDPNVRILECRRWEGKGWRVVTDYPQTEEDIEEYDSDRPRWWRTAIPQGKALYFLSPTVFYQQYEGAGMVLPPDYSRMFSQLLNDHVPMPPALDTILTALDREVLAELVPEADPEGDYLDSRGRE